MSAINALLRINNLLHLRGRNKCCLGLLHFCFCVSKKLAASSGKGAGRCCSSWRSLWKGHILRKDRELKARKDAKGRERGKRASSALRCRRFPPEITRRFRATEPNFVIVLVTEQTFVCLWNKLTIQGSAKRIADFVKQQPGRARQKS